MEYDAVIIGGGAAGLFCAIQAGKRGRKVIVLEHNAEVGRKILISGGGRCNFTNTGTSAENFISRNPHFAKSALSRYTPEDFVDLVKKHGIPFYEKKLGQLFCRESSRAIVDMLLKECRQAGVEIRTGCEVRDVRGTGPFTIETSLGDFHSERLVVACGGLSFRKVGASDLGYRLARQYGVSIVPTRPSLVALTLVGSAASEMAGVSLDASVSCRGRTFRENILFTHRGLSGPAILQISNYWNRNEFVSIDLIPEITADDLRREAAGSKQTVANFLHTWLPKRFADAFAKREFKNIRLNQMTARDIDKLVSVLLDWQVRFADTEGYDRAEVTLGGVSTDELSSQTMASKRVPGLYFIGEVVDVTGWLGGYNFQWAWASGFAAGSDI